MAFKSKLKWVALFVLALSLVSLVAHLSMTKFSSMNLAQYSGKEALSRDIPNIGSPLEVKRNKRLWGGVRSLESLQPYANPRSSYPAPGENSNGFIYAKVFGGFEKIKSSICDLVTISRLLNATLVIPEIQQSTHSKGVSYKFKSFTYLYDEEEFIISLKNDVNIVKSLPEYLKAARKRSEIPIFKTQNSASPNFYIKQVLPKLKKAKVVGLIITDGGCLQSILPPSMSEFQRLRCRVGFHALQFRPEIQILGLRIVERLRASGQPFLAYHPGLVRDTLAYHGCAELYQDVHTELVQHRRAQLIKQGIINDELNVDSHMRRENGSCPLMPEEVGLLLRAMGYPSQTIIYLAGSKTFGGQRLLIPLRALFPNLVDRTTLCSKTELFDLVGPEAPLPADVLRPPLQKTEQQLIDEWKKAGPRPRPLPPPPDRPIYQHEKEGWYAWITETDKEPSPSPMDLRKQAHRLIWDALDYIVSVEADAFIPGFDNDGSGWPEFSGLVIGQRLYERASSRTYRPDRKTIAALFNITRDDMYHPKRNWMLSAKEHLNRSLSEDGLIRQSQLSKPKSFLSHPLPECSCRIPSVEITKQVKGKDGRILYGGEEECPKWMHSARAEGTVVDNMESAEDDDDAVEQLESDVTDISSSLTSLIDHDEEWHLGLFDSWQGTDCCSNWYGISCDPTTHQVTDVSLRGESEDPILQKPGHSASGYMTGSINPSICQLDKLTTLIIADWKGIAGEIPPCVAALPNLRVLDLIGNSLSGKIPEQIGNLKKLTVLNLADNKLTGEIPSSIVQLSSLKHLDLSNNLLAGEIPGNFGNLKMLSRALLSRNQLTGTIPASIGNMYRLADLDLSMNKLSGQIPTQLGKMKVLATLNLDNNMLSGAIPPAVLGNSGVGILNFSRNSLEGNVPDVFGPKSYYMVLDLSFNNLKGPVPKSLSSAKYVGHLDLSHNHLCGEIPVGTPFDHLEASSFDSNDCLCGNPLKTC